MAALVLAELRSHLANRRIGVGLEAIRSNIELFENIKPGQPHAAELIGYLAQWVDVGYPGGELLERLVAQFPASCRAKLPLEEYAHLRMAEAVVAMLNEETERAIHHLEIVLTLAPDLQNREMAAVASFWMGRNYRKQGHYDEAMRFTLAGRDAALEQGYPNMAAIMRVLESWIVFQKGRASDALGILREAEKLLFATDDYITRGNILSAYGRIARRAGKYNQALDYCRGAIDEYMRVDAEHTNLARALANMAFVERLVLRGLRTRVDRQIARRKRSRQSAGAASESTQRDLQKMQEVRQSALEHLAEAERIYARHHQHRGLGNIHSIRGALYFDSDELDLAAAEAERAWRLGEEKHDLIAMARGRILQCTVANALVEEGIDEERNAPLALEYAHDGVRLARQTENRRLIARALVWQGLVESNDYFDDIEAARRSYDEALQLAGSPGGDYLWEDLQALKGRLLSEGSIDTVLREWSQGEVRGRTFQQLADQFAAVVIPKVWEREDRKVSRVAERLKVSPKKVRRILGQAGLLRSGNQQKS